MAKAYTLILGVFFGLLTYFVNYSFDLHILPEEWHWPTIAAMGVITGAFVVAGAINLVSPLN